jgi:hypothetical protein
MGFRLRGRGETEIFCRTKGLLICLLGRALCCFAVFSRVLRDVVIKMGV